MVSSSMSTGYTAILTLICLDTSISCSWWKCASRRFINSSFNLDETPECLMNFDKNITRRFFLINYWSSVKLINYEYTKIQCSCFCYMQMLPRTMRNEYMGLTSGKKRAMKKVGYHIFVYKIIPLLIAHGLPQFK